MADDKFDHDNNHVSSAFTVVIVIFVVAIAAAVAGV